ncbi:ferredoxin [Streptomyces sp. NPDC004237]|uniref:ferredoxin n=1 Tax=unclassified Streptomyces TaxID=2593676 RepID=UPI0033AA3AA1
MKASVDPAKCSGHARCNAVAPQVFTVDDDGYCNIGSDKPVPPEFEAAARAGATNCPERAITLSS